MLETSTHNVMVPNVNRTEYLCAMITDDGFMSLMDTTSGDMREDIKVPSDELGERIKALVDEQDSADEPKDVMVTILSAIGKEQAIDVKTVAGN
jgi:translation initiation factor 5A